MLPIWRWTRPARAQWCCLVRFSPAATMTSRSRQPGRSPMSRRSMTASALKANQRQRGVLTCRKGSDWSLQLSVAAREPENELAFGESGVTGSGSDMREASMRHDVEAELGAEL